MEQLISSLSYLHSSFIVHRDIKPENIIIDKNGNLKLLDFGTAQKFKPGKKMKQTFGTSYYIAPEVLKTSYNEKCDVWSAGVILFIFLYNRPPFDGVDDQEVINKVKKGDYIMDPRIKISREGMDLVKKMLSYDPAKRISAT